MRRDGLAPRVVLVAVMNGLSSRPWSAQVRSVRFVVGVGDIHGRFFRVEQWLAQLEEARGRKVDQVLAVGDVEAFRRGDDHRRKAAKRSMPAEFVDYAEGRRAFPRPLAFVGGNNEDFDTLYDAPEGQELAENVRYLGRVGAVTLAGIRIGFLSGIHAPRFLDAPRVRPRSLETAKHEGYFRREELERALALEDVDLLLTHEWPRGMVAPRPKGLPPVPGLPSSWMGNPLAKVLVERLRPKWLLCGHSHRAFAATITHKNRQLTRVACLDQAARAESAVFWLEFSGREALRAGWGTSGKVVWEKGQEWNAALAPSSSIAEGPGSPAS